MNRDGKYTAVPLCFAPSSRKEPYRVQAHPVRCNGRSRQAYVVKEPSAHSSRNEFTEYAILSFTDRQLSELRSTDTGFRSDAFKIYAIVYHKIGDLSRGYEKKTPNDLIFLIFYSETSCSNVAFDSDTARK